MDDFCRQRGLEILSMRKELERAQMSASAGFARPARQGSKARSVPRSPTERAAEEVRMRLLTAEMQYQDCGCTWEYLQVLGDELAEDEGNADG